MSVSATSSGRLSSGRQRNTRRAESTSATEAPIDTEQSHREKYYLSDSGMAIFKVQGKLYKVHRHFFIRESDVFKGMFECPAGPDENQDGNSDERPIYLPEVTCAEFEALVDFFYDGMFKTLNPLREVKKVQNTTFTFAQHPPRPSTSSPTRTKDQLNIVDRKIHDLLAISLRYAFDKITKEVVSAMDSNNITMDPIPKLLLALKHEALKHWRSDAFDEIVNRNESLTKEEIARLGTNRTAIICKYREERKWNRQLNWRQESGGSALGFDLEPPADFPPFFYLDD